MASPRTVKIGTRRSPLALFQAEYIASALKERSGGTWVGEIVSTVTKGDQLTTERLINSGGKGLFTREIDDMLDRGEVDIAVHSLKDVPSILPGGQDIVAYPERANPRDGFLTTSGVKRLKNLPEGAVVGTASLRREAQTLHIRPDLKIVPFRGNVQTRLKKLETGQADATFLAMAGLERLGLGAVASSIPLDEMLPAAGQGIIAVAARPDTLDADLRGVLDQIDHASTRRMAAAERAFLAELDGSCRTAIAAHLRLDSGQWLFRGEAYSPDGQSRWGASASAKLSASVEDLALLGQTVAKSVRKQAGGSLPTYEAP